MSNKVASKKDQVVFKDNVNLALDESQNIQIKEETEKLKELEESQKKLDLFAQKISAKKRKFNFSLKTIISKILAQETEVVDQLEKLCEKAQKISSKNENCNKTISELKTKFLDFDKEKDQLSKSNEKYENTFANLLLPSNQDKTRDSIFETLTELDDISNQIKSSKCRIFGYQKVLTKYFKDMAPVRTQIHLLNSRIEYENDIQIEDPELPQRNQLAAQTAIASQQFIIEKMRLQNHIKQLNEHIDQAKNAKLDIKNKLNLARSNEKETMLKSVCEQISQYQEALERRKNSQDLSFTTIHNSISKELEIKIEIESVRNELNGIKQQKEDVLENLRKKQVEISNLQNQELSASQEIEVASKDPLTELISKIQQNRDEELRLKQYTIQTYEIDDSELQSLRAAYDSDCNKLQSSLLNFAKFNRAYKKRIVQLEKEIDDKKNQPTPIVIPQTPKIIVLTKRISQLEEEIKVSQQNLDKKKRKYTKKQVLYKDLYNQLDIPTNGFYFRSDLCERIERSMKWFLPLILSQKQSFLSNLTVDFQQLLNNWNAKTLSGVINEAEDFELRSRVFI